MVISKDLCQFNLSCGLPCRSMGFERGGAMKYDLESAAYYSFLITHDSIFSQTNQTLVLFHILLKTCAFTLQNFMQVPDKIVPLLPAVPAML